MTPEQLNAFIHWVEVKIECMDRERHADDERAARRALCEAFGFDADGSGNAIERKAHDPFAYYEVVAHPARPWGFAVRAIMTNAYWPDSGGHNRFWASRKTARRFIRDEIG